ncbi:MAG: peptidylprolyl isomerase [Pseudomonadota bacterium]|nr:peptidylprolyl isomerase [Pseudomonadota bacterium]
MRKLFTAVALLALAASLGGCSRCGFWWDDAPKSCKDDIRK